MLFIYVERMNFVKKLSLGLLAALVFLFLTSAPLHASPLAFSSERICGQTQVETAVKIAQKGWFSAQTVILCESSDYPDAIAATPFAVSLNAPILLTGGKTLDPLVKSELARLNPQKVILLGGTSCLTSAIENELQNLSLPFERIGGLDRYETSLILARHLSSDSLILANGDDFPDALSAATYAGIQQIPIVLTSKDLPASVVQYYQETAPEHLIVIGGEAVIPSTSLSKNNFVVETRLAGYDRYETNAKVVEFSKDTYETNDFYLASGLTFPDAITGTVLASKFKTPLLLTEKEDISPSIYALMREHMKVEPTLSDTPGQPGLVTAFDGLSLREHPTLDRIALTVIPRGTIVDLGQKRGDWYQVTYQEYTGFISANYITPAGSSINYYDLQENGRVYILGGTGVISLQAQNIIEGSASSKYTANLTAAPLLPTPISRNEEDPPVPSVSADGSNEVLVDPFAGIPANALAGKTIVIDPGHGGPDSGAVGPGRTYEKNDNLAIALALNDILKEAGAVTILTRDGDNSPAAHYSEAEDLDARVRIANQSNADLFISIHQNASSNASVRGTETYYSSDNAQSEASRYLAQCIQSTSVSILNTNNRGVKEARFYVIRHTSMPAILLETGFISNPSEEKRLKNSTFQKNVAAAIFQGIYNYYSE